MSRYSGDEWLRRLMVREPDAAKRQQAIGRRIRDKARAMPVDDAWYMLKSGQGFKAIAREWVGGWSQSVDNKIGAALARRIQAEGGAR